MKKEQTKELQKQHIDNLLLKPNRSSFENQLLTVLSHESDSSDILRQLEHCDSTRIKRKILLIKYGKDINDMYRGK